MTDKKIIHTIADSKYRLILIASKRSKQLQRGAPSKLTTPIQSQKPTKIALEEVNRGLIPFEILPPREEIQIIED